MGMSTHIIGFKPPDEKWHKMKAIWNACYDAQVKLPEEVSEYFNDDDPDEAGVEVELNNCIENWEDDSREGYELYIDKLPRDVKIIRFYNSW